MKFLKHIRSRSKEEKIAHADPPNVTHRSTPAGRASWGSRNSIARLSPHLLRRIFTLVCPHCLDESFDALEESMVEDGCMLCDMRDLARCAGACRKWYDVVQDLLYHSVRIDAVHYCDLEIVLSEKRKQRSFFERNADPRDAPQQRLQLLCRTVRARRTLADQVLFLKMPYMTRETCKSDLARTVSVLPNLQHVDLPEGFFSDDASSHTLKQELQARCPEIRKMKYVAGSEQSLSMLADGRHWRMLERLELAHLNVEPSTLIRALGFLGTLHDLKISDMTWLDDSIFRPVPSLPAFPPLQHLSLTNTPSLTAHGLSMYLSRPETHEALTSLTLIDTGVDPSSLHLVLSRAPQLRLLSITETVSRSFPLDPTPPLASRSLQTLHFEITSAPSTTHSLHPPASSHYAYLIHSLRENALPTLRSLYVRDPSLPETLVLSPPAPAFAQEISAPRGPGFHQPLDIYSKGLDELEWNFTSVSPPPAPGRRASLTPQRPVSAYKLLSGTAALGSSSPLWGGAAARDSVVVGNGFGGFLAVPKEDETGRAKGPLRNKGSRQDLWR